MLRGSPLEIFSTLQERLKEMGRARWDVAYRGSDGYFTFINYEQSEDIILQIQYFLREFGIFFQHSNNQLVFRVSSDRLRDEFARIIAMSPNPPNPNPPTVHRLPSPASLALRPAPPPAAPTRQPAQPPAPLAQQLVPPSVPLARQPAPRLAPPIQQPGPLLASLARQLVPPSAPLARQPAPPPAAPLAQQLVPPPAAPLAWQPAPPPASAPWLPGAPQRVVAAQPPVVNRPLKRKEPAPPSAAVPEENLIVPGAPPILIHKAPRIAPPVPIVPPAPLHIGSIEDLVRYPMIRGRLVFAANTQHPDLKLGKLEYIPEENRFFFAVKKADSKRLAQALSPLTCVEGEVLQPVRRGRSFAIKLTRDHMQKLCNALSPEQPAPAKVRLG